MIRVPVSALYIGQRVDLEADPIADPEVYAGAFDMDSPLEEESRFAYAFETVAAIERETPGCIRIDFESGFSCGFPPDHLLDADGEQVRDS